MYYFPKKMAFKNMHYDILKMNYTIIQFQSVISKILSRGEKEWAFRFTKNSKAWLIMKLALQSRWCLENIAFQ